MMVGVREMPITAAKLQKVACTCAIVPLEITQFSPNTIRNGANKANHPKPDSPIMPPAGDKVKNKLAMEGLFMSKKATNAVTHKPPLI